MVFQPSIYRALCRARLDIPVAPPFSSADKLYDPAIDLKTSKVHGHHALDWPAAGHPEEDRSVGTDISCYPANRIEGASWLLATEMLDFDWAQTIRRRAGAVRAHFPQATQLRSPGAVRIVFWFDS
jgi:hypothetical protein